MTAVAEALKTQLARLSPEERAELACYLIDSLDDQMDPGAEAAWEVELARRSDEIRSRRAEGEPAESVFARLRERHP